MIEKLTDNFKTFEESLNGAGGGKWKQIRNEAFEVIAKNGLPKVKDEEYRYTPIGRILEKNFNLSSVPSSKSPNGGVDRGYYPANKMFTIGINASF